MCKSGQGWSNDPDIKQTKQSPNALGWLQSALSFAWSIPALHRNLLITTQHGYFLLCAIAFAIPSNWNALHPLFNQRKKAFIHSLYIKQLLCAGQSCGHSGNLSLQGCCELLRTPQS